MNNFNKKNILSKFIKEVWSEGNADAAERYIAESYTIHHDPGDPWHQRTLTRAEFKERVRSSRAPFPDQCFKLHQTIADGNAVVATWFWTGTHAGDFPGFPASGKQIKMSGATVYYFANDRINGHWPDYRPARCVPTVTMYDMKYKNLGNTGLKVSELCLGCMTFGVPDRGDHPWTLPEEPSRALIRQAVNAGINYFDTADAYSDGTSEEIVGRALKDFSRRDEVVIATKVFFPMHKGPNGGGLSRKAIFAAIDASLRRLGTDYVDLYQIHRWDYSTPIEETLEALHDVVKSGKVRYLGASSMYAWQFSKALHLARQYGWTPFVSMQNHYNLLYREEEREMMPLCTAERIAVVPWSPLARGRLTREWDSETARTRTDEYGNKLYVATVDADRKVVEHVAAIAAARRVPKAQVALAWVAQKPFVTAPIVGASKPQHLDDAVAALTLKLEAAEIAQLEAPYLPHAIVGLS